MGACEEDLKIIVDSHIPLRYARQARAALTSSRWLSEAIHCRPPSLNTQIVREAENAHRTSKFQHRVRSLAVTFLQRATPSFACRWSNVFAQYRAWKRVISGGVVEDFHFLRGWNSF